MLAAIALVVLGSLQFVELIRCAEECLVDFVALRGDTAKVMQLPDARLTTWILGWVQHALLTRPASLFDANVFYPATNTLAGSEHLMGLALVMLPLRLLTSNALLIHQTALIVSTLLLGLTTFALVRWLTGSAWAGFLAGAVTMHMPWRWSELAHIQLLSAQWFPLVWLTAARLMYGELPRRNAWILAVALSIQFLSSYYLAYFVALTLAVLVVAIAAYERPPLSAYRRLATSLAVPTVLLVLASIPYLERDWAAELVLRVKSPGSPGLGLAWALIAPKYELLAPHRPGTFGYYVPLVVAALAVVAAVLCLWPYAGTRDPRARRVRIFVVGLWLVTLAAFVMSLGRRTTIGETVISLPSAWAASVVPGFANLRGHLRWGVVIGLTCPIIAGLGVWLYERAITYIGSKVVRITLLSVSRAGMAAVLAMNIPWAVVPARLAIEDGGRDVYRALGQLPYGPVVEIPWPMEVLHEAQAESSYTLASTLHWRPILNGFTAYRPRTYEMLKRIAQDLPSEPAVETLSALTGLRWIVVHATALRFPRQLRAWTNAVDAGHLRQAYADGNARIYEVPARHSSGKWLQLLISPPRWQRTLTGLPRAPLVLDAGSGSFTAFMPKTFKVLGKGGTRQRARLIITNLTDRPWAGLDIDREGLVALRYSFVSLPSNKMARRGTLRLDADVPAHGQLAASVFIPGPTRPGDYLLRLELVQHVGGTALTLPLSTAEQAVSVRRLGTLKLGNRRAPSAAQ